MYCVLCSTKKSVSQTKWILFVVMVLIPKPLCIQTALVFIFPPLHFLHNRGQTWTLPNNKNITKVKQHRSDVITSRKNEFSIDISDIQWWEDKFCTYVIRNLIPGGSRGPKVRRLCGRVQEQKRRRLQDEAVVKMRRPFGIQSKCQKTLSLFFSPLYILCKSFNVG